MKWTNLMKWMTLMLAIMVMSTLAQGITIAHAQTDEVTTEEVTKDSITTEEAEPGTTEQKSEFWENVLGFLLILVYVAVLVYMIMEIRKTHYTPVSVEAFKQMRNEQNLPVEASDEENQKAMTLLDEIFDSWKIVRGEGEEEYRSPRRKKHIERSKKILEGVKDIMPTDKEVVDRMNEVGDVVADNASRKYAGSNKLLLVAVGLIVLFMLIGVGRNWFQSFMNLSFIWGGMILYYVSSYAPKFLIDKRVETFGNSNISSGLVSLFAGFFLAAPTYTVETRWSDGRRTRDTEFNILGLFLMIIGLVFIGVFISVFGILNFVRNFVLYV